MKKPLSSIAGAHLGRCYLVRAENCYKCTIIGFAFVLIFQSQVQMFREGPNLSVEVQRKYFKPWGKPIGVQFAAMLPYAAVDCRSALPCPPYAFEPAG